MRSTALLRRALAPSQFAGKSAGSIVEAKVRAAGISHVFGYTGGAVLPVVDPFYESPVEFVVNSNESCSGHVAEGYARASGKPGIIVTTSGPGVTNLATPMRDAQTDSVPLIAFCGQVPTAAIGTDAFQECPSCDVMRPLAKWVYQVRDPDEFEAVVDTAFAVATHGRPGPVFIDCPKDIMTAAVGAGAPKPVPSSAGVPSVADPPPPRAADVERVLKALCDAKRPVIVCGGGATSPAASAAVRELAELLGVPVTTTIHGMGVYDEEAPLALHMLGMHGAAYANFAVQMADAIVAFGSRFDDRTTGKLAQYAPHAFAAAGTGTGGVFQVDISPASIGRSVKPTFSAIADSAAFLPALLAAAKATPAAELGAERREPWRKLCGELKATYPFNFAPAAEGALKGQDVVREIAKQTAGIKDFRVTTGVGNHQMYACQYIRWRRPRAFYSSGSLGTMGVGVPFAIGAQLAAPAATVVCVDGDGSFNMTSSELLTLHALRAQLPNLKVVIMNDGRQSMIHTWQKLFYSKRFLGTHNTNPSYSTLAAAYNLPSVTCATVDDLPAAVAKLLATKGPVIGDFQIVGDVCLPMVAPGKALDEMFLFQSADISTGRMLEAIPHGTHSPS